MGARLVAWVGVTLLSIFSGANAHARLVTWAHGAWSWFGDPRAVYVQSPQAATFVGWIGWNGEITIGEYDPLFGLMRSHVVGHEYHDDHSVPSILVEPDKQLTLFWSGHNGREMYYRTSTGAEEISSTTSSSCAVPVNTSVRPAAGFTPSAPPTRGRRISASSTTTR